MTHAATTPNLSELLKDLDEQSKVLKRRVARISTESETADIAIRRLQNLRKSLRGLRIACNAVRDRAQDANTTLADEVINFVRVMKHDLTLNVPASIFQLRQQTNNLINWIDTNVPANTALSETDVNGDEVPTVITSANMAGFRTIAADFDLEIV